MKTVFTLLFSSLLFMGPMIATETSLTLTVNMENTESLPKNFHMDPSLHISGSGQFSEKSLKTMLQTIPSKKIILVDLREESHGFIHGVAVSWRDGEKNWANKGKSLSQITQDEQKLLQNGISEAELAKKLGIGYVRIPVTDHTKPTNQEVDQFIQLMKGLDKDIWLHFHCSAGKGRTTTFMAMVDMIHNASKSSFKEILERQHRLGGKDLDEEGDRSSWKYPYHVERQKFLAEFYNYCLKNPNLEQSYSQFKTL